jgi:hypothetical protein
MVADGIDVCGQRLADEMRAVIERHPSLQRISVVGRLFQVLACDENMCDDWIPI